MLQDANRLSEIAHDTFDLKVEPRTYQDRKVAEVCTYPGCSEPPSDDCNECPLHRAKTNAAKRRRRLRNRREWTRKKLCLRCGDRRRPGSKWCVMCLAGAGKLRLQERSKQRTKSREISAAVGFDARLEQSPDGKLRVRRRFHGQGKRGRQSIAQLDAQDHEDAEGCAHEAWVLLAYFHSDEAKILPRVQRDDIRDRAVSELRRAARWFTDMADRNDPKSRPKAAADEDE